MSLVLNRKRDRADNDVDETQETHRNVKLHIKKHIAVNRKRMQHHQSADNVVQKRNRLVEKPVQYCPEHEFEYGTMYSTYPYDPIKMVFL